MKVNDLFEKIKLDVEVEIVSTQYNDLSKSKNFGRCSKCGTWASDKRNDEKADEFSNGAFIEGKWFCDLCLPEDHPNHF